MSQEFKQTTGKTKWNLVNTKLLEGIAKVRAWATSTKYKDPNSWKKVDPMDYFEAIQRHKTCLDDGEHFDIESGELHIDHIATNCMFLKYFYNEGMILTERGKS